MELIIVQPAQQNQRVAYKATGPTWNLRSASLIAFLLAFSLSAFSQVDCSVTLNQAQDEFDAGHLYGIPTMLEECISDGFTREQSIQAYRLLTVTYLYIDDPQKAEESYLSLLSLDPEYRISSTDPVEIELLSKNYKTDPFFTFHRIKIGTNFSTASIIHNNGVDNTSNSAEDYLFTVGFQAGTGMDLHINRYISIMGEVNYSLRRMKYENIPFDMDRQTFTETQHWVNLPVAVRLTLPPRRSLKEIEDDEEKKLKYRLYPFAYAGHSYNFIAASRMNVELVDVTPQIGNEGPSESPVTGTPLNIGKIRNEFTRELIFGAGVMYRLEYELLKIDIRYSMGLTNILDTETQFDFSDPDIRDLTFRYGLVNDDFRLDNISISFGYVKPLYKPRKITKRGFKGFIRGIFKKKK